MLSIRYLRPDEGDRVTGLWSGSPWRKLSLGHALHPTFPANEFRLQHSAYHRGDGRPRQRPPLPPVFFTSIARDTALSLRVARDRLNTYTCNSFRRAFGFGADRLHAPVKDTYKFPGIHGRKCLATVLDAPCSGGLPKPSPKCPGTGNLLLSLLEERLARPELRIPGADSSANRSQQMHRKSRIKSLSPINPRRSYQCPHS